MAGSLINTYTQLDTDILALQLTSDANFVGKHNVSLTNYDTTGVPAIAAGSIVECNGALFEFTADEAVTGTPSNGTVYIQIIPSTTTCTAAFTNTAPTWSDAKQGFYGTGAAANYRYLEFEMTRSSATVYSNKHTFTHDDNVKLDKLAVNTLTATTLTATTINATIINITDDLILNDDLILATGSRVSGGYVESPLPATRKYFNTSGNYQSANLVYSQLVNMLSPILSKEYAAHGILHVQEATYYVNVLSVFYNGLGNIIIKGVRSDTYNITEIVLNSDNYTPIIKLNMVY
jgi:hypothetical protein